MIALLFAFYLSHTGAGVEPSVTGGVGVKTGPTCDVVVYGATPAGIAAALAAADAGATRVVLLEPTYQIGKISLSYKRVVDGGLQTRCYYRALMQGIQGLQLHWLH